jgi:hypothetical protein
MRNTCLAIIAVLALGVLSPAGGLTAAPPAWRITVAAGDVDRSNLPVRAAISATPAELSSLGVSVKFADGSQVAGQIVPRGLLDAAAGSRPLATDAAADTPQAWDILFVLPKLTAGSTADLIAELVVANPAGAVPGQSARLQWGDSAGAAELFLSGKPLVRYEMPTYDGSNEQNRVKTYKPFHHVFDPATGMKLTKGDGGGYTHHRGIFFGYNRISHGPDKKQSSDCWHCKSPARQEHREVLWQKAVDVAGVQRVAIDWIGSDGMKLLGETRELDIVPVSGGTVIDFASRLVADAPVRLDGDPQHSGVHFRAANEVHESTKGQTYYLRPGVKAKPGDYRNWPADKTYVNAAWHAASFVVGGQRYTVLRANRPANPGEARMSERDYGRFGSYFEYDLTADKPLEVGYRFWVQPGEMTLEEAARISADYAQPAKVTAVRRDAGGAG